MEGHTAWCFQTSLSDVIQVQVIPHHIDGSSLSMQFTSSYLPRPFPNQSLRRPESEMLPTADGAAWEEWRTFRRWSLAGGCGSPVGGLGNVFWPTPPVHSVSRPQIQCDKANLLLLGLPSEMECVSETSV